MKTILKWGALMLLAILLAGAVALLWYRSASLPQIDGRLHAAGLAAPVDIVRDAEGVPHIYAGSVEDAYFALGFAHAQDRLWQMEMNRRIAAGRVAEILGDKALPTDRFLRTLGVRRNAERIFANLAPDTQTVLLAYARGINAYLATRKGPLPPEFLLTGAPAPQPWEPADSIAWQTMMAWDLSANWTQEILRMRLAQRLPLERIQEFMPPYPGDKPLPTQDYTQLYRQLGSTADQLATLARSAPPSYVEGMGSNNWVVNGAQAASGKPLLANDPHLGLSAPSLWYFAHLSAPGLNVIGATLPGLPAVILGRNDRIAWGFTNTAPDTQDLFIEQVHPDDPSRYRTPGGWEAFSVREEIIRVKGQKDVRLTVRESRHGPVISGALSVLGSVGLQPERHVVAFAWTALRPDDLSLQAGLGFNRARNWDEFLRAARDFAAPQQNIVYADVDGNIGFVAPARVPVRKPENDLKGLAPAPGWDARYDWDGFIPFERLPQSFNPRAGSIHTANEKIVGDDYPYFLTSEWSMPYRSQRIGQLLAPGKKHDLNSFAAMQADDLSLAMQELLPVLRAAQAGSPRAAAVLARLQRWDGRMAAERAEPLIVTAWLRELARMVFIDELGETLFNEYWEYRNVHQPLANVLLNRHGQARWCADAAKPAVDGACEALLAASLDKALGNLSNRYGDDMDAWQWGRAHMARSEHRPFGKFPGLSSLFNIRVPTSGDTYTINVGRNNPRDEDEPFTNRHAAGLRALYDLGDLENSRFMHSTGQSGNPLSPWYGNLAKRWAIVEYLPMQTRREVVEARQGGTLRLLP